jgi:hypothetical protein
MNTRTFSKYWSLTWVTVYTVAFALALFCTIKTNAFFDIGGFSEPIDVHVHLPEPIDRQISEAQERAQETGEIQIVPEGSFDHIVGPNGEIS